MEIPWRYAGTSSESLPPAFERHPAQNNPNVERDRQEPPGEEGRSLFEDVFFFCAVKNVGELPGGGCIYIETVVDSESGVAFAKVYPARTALNAVDILASRVLPYFRGQGLPIKEIHTRRASDYCGLPVVHPFEAFLATSRIQHRVQSRRDHPHFHLCEEFYWFLLKEFLQPELRKKFDLSLGELQRDLDGFLEAYNAMQLKGRNQLPGEALPPANFSVDL
jgi:hypothetical protein